jgi:hypothetical protein
MASWLHSSGVISNGGRTLSRSFRPNLVRARGRSNATQVIPPHPATAAADGRAAGRRGRKGVVAALLVAKLCANARFRMLTEPDLAAAITRLNVLMNHPGMGDRFVTLVAAILDPRSHTVTLVNAGHLSRA